MLSCHYKAPFVDCHGLVVLTLTSQLHRLEVVPGFTTSIAKYEGGNMLSVDIIHKILRMDTVLDALYDLYHSMRTNDVSAFHNSAAKNFVGNIVMTRQVSNKPSA